MSQKFRTEKDSMGEMQVPASAYYAAQTQRAVENFPISTLKFTEPMIKAMGLVKRSAAVVNNQLGVLDDAMKDAIVAAAEEVESGKLNDHFVVDIFQTGSGTSSNMNVNEVVANRAKEMSGGEIKVHPNDHVNASQSSNDTIPTEIHIATAREINDELIPGLKVFAESLGKKAEEYKDLVKTGRTHLQDATPVTLGQEFGGYKAQIEQGVRRLERSLETIYELPLGGTAVGTGLNTPLGFADKVIKEIASRSGLPFVEASNHFEAQSAKDALVEMSGQLKTIATSVIKIANDIRLLGTGPRCGLGEISLPAVQPGSSIMPGKINPVICESAIMVGCQVIGNDAAVTTAGHVGSTFELNVAMPVIAHNILESISLLANTARNMATKCVDGITANPERLHELAEANISTVTALVPIIGYDKSAEIAKTAWKTGEPLRAVALRESGLPEDELNKALDLVKMTKPGL